MSNVASDSTLKTKYFHSTDFRVKNKPRETARCNLALTRFLYYHLLLNYCQKLQTPLTCSVALLLTLYERMKMLQQKHNEYLSFRQRF